MEEDNTTDSRTPEVSIVILNYNGGEMLEDCLLSITKQIPQNFEIIVVDNASTDNPKAIIEKYPSVKYIQNETNYGFAKGNNIGIAKARGKYIVLLNNDCMVFANWLNKLVEVLKANPNIKIVNSKVINKFRGKYDFAGYGYSNYFGHNTIDFNLKGDRLLDSLGAAGGAFIFENIGKPIFDEDYFMYGEDLYFGWLQRIQGGQCKINPQSVAIHNGSIDVTRKRSNLISFHQEKNRLTNFITLYETKTKIKLLPLLLMEMLFSTLFDIKQIGPRLQAYGWTILNYLKLRKKAKEINKLRKVSDDEIMKTCMSCKFFEDALILNKFFKTAIVVLNKIQRAYCKLVRLNAVDL